MARLWGAWLLAFLVILQPGALAWTQAGGGPGHARSVIDASRTLDILGAVGAPEASYVDVFTGPGAVVSPDGEVWLVRAVQESGECVLESVDPESAATTASVRLDGCLYGRLRGLDPIAGRVLVCSYGSSDMPVLQAYGLDGALAWAVTPSDMDVASDAVAAIQGRWTQSWICGAVALDVANRLAYAPFTAELNRYFGDGLPPLNPVGAPEAFDHRIAAVDLDTGEVVWQREVPYRQMLQEGPAAAFYVHEPGQGGYFQPGAVTLTSAGLVVVGRSDCMCGDSASADTSRMRAIQVVAVWMTTEGDLVGAKSAQVEAAAGARAVDGIPGGSAYAASDGPFAAMALGGSLIAIHPQEPEPIANEPIHTVEALSAWVYYRPPAAAAGRILLPLPHSVTSYAAQGLTQDWAWADPDGGSVSDLIVTTSGSAFALTAVEAGDSDQAFLSRLDLATGTLGQRLPLPLSSDISLFDGVWLMHIVPISAGRYLVVGHDGSRVLVGAAPEEIAERLYPAVGERVTLPASEATRYIAWGDGSVEAVEPGVEPTHVYATLCQCVATVSDVAPEGTTRTASFAVHVGGTPPPQLTSIQRAFSPEQQNWTFFFLGLFVTVLGVAFTVGRQRRRFNKLERELAAVEEIRMMSVEDPRAAVIALKAYRDRLPHDLARGKIDDSQYQVLDIRSARLLKVLRTRMFAPYDSRLTLRYHRLLDAAFEDAILQPSERNALVRALEEESELRSPERVEIVGILDDFTSARPDAPMGRVAA